MKRALLSVIILIAFAVRLWGLRFGLPHTYARPDETIVIEVALSFLRGNLRPTFYDYPWLYMWLLAGLYFLYYLCGRFVGVFKSLGDMVASWHANWTPFFLIPRALTATLGAATVWPVYRSARLLWDDATALVAALFIALAFLHVRDSHYATTDITMTFLLMLSVSFLIEAHLTRRTRDFVIAGLIGGLAAATKYNALLMIVPLMASYLLNIFEHPEHRGKAMRDLRVFLYGVPFLATFAIGVPFLAFDLHGVAKEMTLLGESMTIGSGPTDVVPGWFHH